MNRAVLFGLEFLYEYVSFYPCVLLCCIPFADKYEQTVRKIAVRFAYICIPVAATPAALYAFFGNGDTASLVALVFMFGSFLYYRKALREGLNKLLFTFFMVAHMVCLATEIECAAVSLTGILLLRGTSGGIPSFLLCTLLRLVAYFVIWRFITRILTPRLRRIKSDDMRGLWGLPVIFMAASIYRIIMHVHDGTRDIVFAALTIFFALLSFSIEEISRGIQQVAEVVHQNSATAEQSAAAAEEMSSQSYVLADTVAQFKLRDVAAIGQRNPVMRLTERSK